MYFIAEIGVNHEANLKKAYKCIKDAKEGGAQAVKLQCYKAEKIASKYAGAYWDKKEEKENSQLKLYKKFDKFEYKDYQKIINYCKKIKIDFIITPFDIDTIDFFKSKVKFFKISSSDITNLPLIKKIAETRKPVILSTGASTKKEIKNAYNLLKNKSKRIIILHCILNYPTKKENANLNMILDLKKYYKDVGLSDHSIPNDSHKILIYAYMLGVRFFEKHFTINKKKRGNDHFHSFNKKDVKTFFKNLCELKIILGNKFKTYLKSEIISRKNARRSIFLKKNLKKNQRIRKDDLIMLRPAIGINPFDINKIYNKKINKNKNSGDILRLSDLK